MNILYIGDVMGEMGIATLEKVLPDLRSERSIDVVIAQAENVSEGKGLTVVDYERLKALGVDGFTGGNHTTARTRFFQCLRTQPSQSWDLQICMIVPAQAISTSMSMGGGY